MSPAFRLPIVAALLATSALVFPAFSAGAQPAEPPAAAAKAKPATGSVGIVKQIDADTREAPAEVPRILARVAGNIETAAGLLATSRTHLNACASGPKNASDETVLACRSAASAESAAVWDQITAHFGAANRDYDKVLKHLDENKRATEDVIKQRAAEVTQFDLAYAQSYTRIQQYQAQRKKGQLSLEETQAYLILMDNARSAQRRKADSDAARVQGVANLKRLERLGRFLEQAKMVGVVEANRAKNKADEYRNNVALIQGMAATSAAVAGADDPELGKSLELAIKGLDEYANEPPSPVPEPISEAAAPAPHFTLDEAEERFFRENPAPPVVAK